MSQSRALPIVITKFEENRNAKSPDLVACEEPLEIRLGYGPEHAREQRAVAITMRTPGHDFELALGFLLSEGIVRDMDDVRHIDYCTDSRGNRSENIVRVEIAPSISLDWEMLSRNFYTNSSCGICGKASIESISEMCPAKIHSDLKIPASMVYSLSEKMRKKQGVFEHTGGLHASALFDAEGELLMLREDVGRHNALDKIIGAAFLKQSMPLHQNILMLSGRASFELVQKSIVAGIPIVCAVGAPSSLAVQTAREFGVTLVGFTKAETFNCYSEASKILG